MSTILMYHYLGTPPSEETTHRPLWVPEEEFASQLDHLKAVGIRTVSAEEYTAGLEQGKLERSVWLTFDDGKEDNHRLGLPLLKARGQRATFFIIADRSLSGEKGYMDLIQLREMLAEGMSIGSHTLSHPHLARIPKEQMREEVSASKKKLEDALGIAITTFCYPYGNWNGDVQEAVREAGYTVALSTIRDNQNTAADRWALRRAMMQPGRTGLSFRYLLSPVYHWVHARKNRKRWKNNA